MRAGQKGVGRARREGRGCVGDVQGAPPTVLRMPHYVATQNGRNILLKGKGRLLGGVRGLPVEKVACRGRWGLPISILGR